MGDIALGILVTIGSFFIGGLGSIGIPFVYFVVRKPNKVFARAMGWTYAAILINLVWAFYVARP